MTKRFPPGWDVNPSAWDERIPYLGAALIAVLLPADRQNELWLQSSLAAVLVTGIFGGERRWIKHPLFVVFFGLLAGPCLFVIACGTLIAMAIQDSWSWIALVRIIFSLLLIGPAMDEVLASLQYLRRRILLGART